MGKDKRRRASKKENREATERENRIMEQLELYRRGTRLPVPPPGGCHIPKKEKKKRTKDYLEELEEVENGDHSNENNKETDPFLKPVR